MVIKTIQFLQSNFPLRSGVARIGRRFFFGGGGARIIICDVTILGVQVSETALPEFWRHLQKNV